MNREIDRDQWSESSKNSYAYYYKRTYYDDIHYVCRKCKHAAVFTGEDQKISYEVKKNYIWQRRTLCAECNAKLYALKIAHKALEARWAKGKSSLSQDQKFLQAWLAVLASFPLYGSRIGGSMEAKIRRLAELVDAEHVAKS